MEPLDDETERAVTPVGGAGNAANTEETGFRSGLHLDGDGFLQERFAFRFRWAWRRWGSCWSGYWPTTGASSCHHTRQFRHIGGLSTGKTTQANDCR